MTGPHALPTGPAPRAAAALTPPPGAGDHPSKDPTPRLVAAIALSALTLGAALAPAVLGRDVGPWFGPAIWLVAVMTAWHTTTSLIHWQLYTAFKKFQGALATQQLATLIAQAQQQVAERTAAAPEDPPPLAPDQTVA